MAALHPRGPLVALGPELTHDQLRRYQRHLGLPGIGSQGQRRLCNAKVLIVGAGGLGAPTLQYLAAAGVATLGIVDDDVVDASNLQRQVIHGVADVGRPKVDSAADAVARLDPTVQVVRHHVRLTPDNVLAVLADYDLVLDGTDNFGTRYLVSDAAEILAKPVVWGAILRFSGQVAVFWTGHGPTYRDVFPTPPTPGSVPSCADAGVFGALPGVVGSLMATEAIKLITGVGEPLLGRLLTYDALSAEFRTLRVAANPDRARVTTLEEPATACALEPGPAERLDPAALGTLLARRETGELDLAVVDVRSPHERAAGMIPGAIGVEVHDLATSGAAALPPAARGCDLVLYCQSGVRSAFALRVLRPHFAAREESVRHLDGGYDAWLRAGRQG